MVGKSYFKVDTVYDFSEIEELEEKYKDENEQTRTRVLDEFVRTAACNGMEDPSLALRAYIALCRRRRNGQPIRRWSTIATYIGYLSPIIRPTLTLHQRLRWKRVKSVVALAHADEDSFGAPTATAAEVLAILPLLPEAERRCVAGIAWSGARLADLRRLRGRQCRFRRKSIALEVRITKTRRRRAHRRILRINNVQRIIGFYVDPSLLETMTEADEAPLFTCKVDEVNESLRTACTALKIARLTTYSFRKFFINQVATHFQHDWHEVIRYTLHTGIDVVAAHYDALAAADEDE